MKQGVYCCVLHKKQCLCPKDLKLNKEKMKEGFNGENIQKERKRDQMFVPLFLQPWLILLSSWIEAKLFIASFRPEQESD